MRYIYTNIFEQETRYAKDVPIRDKKNTHSLWMAFYSVYVKIKSNMRPEREQQQAAEPSPVPASMATTAAAAAAAAPVKKSPNSYSNCFVAFSRTHLSCALTRGDTPNKRRIKKKLKYAYSFNRRHFFTLVFTRARAPSSEIYATICAIERQIHA